MSVAKFRARNGARNLLAGKCDVTLKDDASANARANAGLDEAGHTASDFRFELNRFTRDDGAENFYGTEGGEFEIAQRFTRGIALGNDAGELRAGFGDENAGHERRSGKMAA